jgi:predicted phosphodiesterase
MTAFKIMSDLHLEFQDGREHEFLVPYDGEDALILAGDIQCGMVMKDWFCELLKHRPVFYIMGNHEYYGHDLSYLKQHFQEFEIIVNDTAKAQGYRHKLFCLQDDAVAFQDTIILGTTLWTSFDDNPVAAIAAQRCMNDFVQITCNDEELTPAMILDEHRKSLAFLNAGYGGDTGLKPVIVTHHAPSWQSVNEQHRGGLLNAAYVNRLDEMVEQITLWIHGHTHYSFDYQIGDGTVVCNPRGYYPRHLNKDFNVNLVVTV